jgi:sugar lactone lactonase YvrE
MLSPLCVALRRCLLLLFLVFSALLTARAQSHYEPYYFGRLAGNYPGSDDGTGSDARFFDPESVAVDAAGNVYVADYVNSTIRKVTPAGVVSTFAGLAEHVGDADGPGGAARFYNPTGVAVDASGNVYVAGFTSNTIRKITPTGVVSTFAGVSGSNGSEDGVGLAARFYSPSGVAVDSAGNIYVADLDNNTIRKISPTRVVTTFAGLAGHYGTTDGTGSAARFGYPNGVAVDTHGNVYVADTHNDTIRKITPAGVVTTLAGLAGNPGSADGTGSAARFNLPWKVTVDAADVVYVADNLNHVIRKITPGGVVTTIVGSAGNPGSADGMGSAARFNHPVAVAVNSAGIIFVGDGANNTIRKITPDLAVTTVAGVPTNEEPGSADGTGSSASFALPSGVAVDGARNAYVADTANNTIRKITPAGVVTTLAGLAASPGGEDGTGSAARFNIPEGVAADTAGNVYVADTGNSKVRKITPAGVVTTLAGPASGVGFDAPKAVAVDNAGNVYVADTGNDVIRKITPDGIVSTLGGGIGSWDFYTPSGVAVDSAGNIYVADTSHLEIRKLTPDGVVTTLAGSLSYGGSADGTGSLARFSEPSGVAVDGADNVYVTDKSNDIVRKITPAGVVTTLAGSPTLRGNVAGVGSAARFLFPQGIAVDSIGNVYVADAWNHTIRIGNPVTPAPQLANISTRLAVGSGDNALIGGFIITGTQTTKIILRAIGPSLSQVGVSGVLADPILELYDSGGGLLATNDDWRFTQFGGIIDGSSGTVQDTGFAPSQDRESAIVATLSQGAYTTIIRGNNNTTGVALVEAFDLDWGVDAKLANISTRGFVQTGDNVMIGGTIVRGSADSTVLIRAIGPSLANLGVPNALSDPTLELHDGNGALMNSNDNWRDTQEAEIEARGLAPTNDLESAILATLSPGGYTAIVRGKNDTTGVAVVEAYELGN